MKFPIPPAALHPHEPTPNREPAPPQAAPAPDPSLGNGKLDSDEVQFILRTTLRHEHRDDPNILRFINAYIRCRDTAQASREAGLPSNAGHHLRNRPDIHACIVKLTERSVAKYGFDASEVVEKVKEIAFVDPIEFLNPDGSYKKLQDIRPEARRAIKKMKVKNIYEDDPNGMPRFVGEIIEIELWDKMKGVELLGREKDIFKEKKVVEHDMGRNMASILLESAKRAEERQSALGAREVVAIEGKVEGENQT